MCVCLCVCLCGGGGNGGVGGELCVDVGVFGVVVVSSFQLCGHQ